MERFSREARERRRHAKRYRSALVEEVVALLFETSEQWPNIEMEHLARAVASLASGDRSILVDARNHPRSERLRKVVLKLKDNRDLGKAIFILNFHEDPRVIEAFARYQGEHR